MADYLRQHRSAAFLVLHRGALVHETYFPPYGPDSRTNVFSVAKTVMTLLTGAAVADGIVPSFDAPLATWVTEYANHPQGRSATLAQLSAMTSGHEWDENYYLPLNATTELYFGGNAQATVLRHGFEREPGSGYEYSSATTQLLGIALQRRAAGARAGPDAGQLCVAAPVAAARAGRGELEPGPAARGRRHGAGLLLHPHLGPQHGAAGAVAAAAGAMERAAGAAGGLRPAHDRAPTARWITTATGCGWTRSTAAPFYFMQGHLGQYAIVVPSRELVIVRTGQWRTKERQRHPSIPEEVYLYVEEALAMVGPQ